MKNLIKMLASLKGRVTKIILGMFLLSYGFEKDPLFIIIGIIPLLTGVFDIVLIAPLFNLPMSGKEIRKTKIKK